MPLTEDDIKDDAQYDGERLANEHWHNFVKPLMQLVYTTAFTHGYKHGREERDGGD